MNNTENLIVADDTESPSQELKIKVKFKLICASKCKKFALEMAQAHRAQMFTRVSEDFLLACEANLKNFILSRVKSHPSKGKTLL
jgi:Trk K+ transport system NAD-binding subunit